VDQFRLKPQGMHICTECGFVSYPSKWQSYEKIKAHYRADYRKPPTSANYFTGQRKIAFHNSFLSSLFEEWTLNLVLRPKIFEVGAAFGMVLGWLKDLYPNSVLAGTEWATSYKRVCKHEFGLDLVDDFDDTVKHDLIISYKVAEHQLDADKELRKYALSLTENGRVYISVPTWFDSANNFGMSGFDLEYYYDPNHINCWTRDIFESILARAGLEIVKKDIMMYDSTYLCKRNDDLMATEIHRENVDAIKDKMNRMKQAYLLYQDQKYAQAIAMYSDYPQAHIALFEMNRAQNFKMGWAWMKKQCIEPALAQCPTSVDLIVAATDMAMRSEQWQEAIKWGELGLKVKPENPSSLSQLINIMREIALRATDEKSKEHYFKQARDISRHLRMVSTQHFREAVDMIYTFDAQLN
jgi:hypothetical protein